MKDQVTLGKCPLQDNRDSPAGRRMWSCGEKAVWLGPESDFWLLTTTPSGQQRRKQDLISYSHNKMGSVNNMSEFGP